MKKTIIILMSLLIISTGYGQKEISLHINHLLGTENYSIDKVATNDLDQTFKITRVNYYISGIQLIHDGGIITPLPNSYILVKGNIKSNALLGEFAITNIEGITFSIGVDSPVNNEDPGLQVPGSPLYFQTPSMHWGWSAGYRFVALEGFAGDGLATEFQLHGLWNENYFEQTITTTGVATDSTIDIYLDADYAQALKGVDVASGPIDHGVNTADLVVLENFRDYVFSAGSPTAIQPSINISKLVKVYPIPATSSLKIDVANEAIHSVQFIDIMGRVCKTVQLQQQNTINISDLTIGSYILRFYDAANNLVGHYNIVTQ